MQIGFTIPTSGPLATAEILTRLAVEAEAIGFDYICFADHIIDPIEISARYPYSQTGEFPQASRGERQEQLIAIAYLAAKTQRIRFMTTVMVVPHRPAVLAAKMLASIDVLSAGRLMVGAGAGWLEEEFAAIGAPSFAERGAVTDEYLQAFRELWTKDKPRFAGRFVNFANITLAPKPVQKPHPPLWIGGESGAAMRRAARLGDGWYPIGTNPRHPLNTLSRYRAAADRLRELANEAGREPGSVALGLRVHRHGAAVPATANDGERHLFGGSAADIVADLHALGEIGVVAADFSLPGPTPEVILAAMRQFGEEVLAKRP
jgi:probable F420-dependent oxidoreductase